MSRRAFVLVAAAALLGCGGPEPQTPATARPRADARVEPEILAQFRQTVFAYPPGSIPPTGFAVARDGIVLVPTGGGLYAAGWGWLIEPQKAPIVSASRDGDGLLVADASEQGARVSRWARRARVADVAKLPPGVFDVASAPGGGLWVSGRASSGEWLLMHGDGAGQLATVASLKHAITAVAPVAAGSAVVAVDKTLLLVRRGGDPVVLAQTKEAIEGADVDASGNVVFSTVRGIFRLEKGNQYHVIAVGLHGPIHVDGGRIYVMRRDRAQILELTPPPTYKRT